ncbi:MULTISPECIES: sugar-binding domain-containing protein [Microbacterium]|uniref:sugar-binding domain-containing protein n=1 Tax=Microbacterium TaxID=33882 RepID=UPI0027D8A395|nr:MULTISPECIES: sugar-binding domain-containing protein [Microbacterium]
MTQQEIGDEFAFSRVSISRLLEEARRRGVVRFDVGAPVDRDRGLERELLTSLRASSSRAAAELQACRVMPALHRGDAAHRWRLGAHAAAVLASHLPEGGTLAIASSRTTAPLVRAGHLLPKLAFVAELLGSSDRTAGMVAGGDLAQTIKAVHRPIPAPFIRRLEEREFSAAARSRIRAAIESAVQADAALFGAGSMRRFDGTGVHAPVSQQTLTEAAAAGAVGHCLGIFLDSRGREIPSVLDAVRVGASPTELRRVARRVLLVWTPEKAPIARAAVASALVTDLVTDETTARAILSEPVSSSTE